MLWKPFILDFKSGHKAPQRSFEKYNISAALKQPSHNAPRHGFELTELIGLNGLNAVVRLSLTGRFHFEKKWNILFFRKSTVALICVYFIEGGALSSNTVLIAFEGFNFFNQYVFYQFVWHLRASLHFWSIITTL